MFSVNFVSHEVLAQENIVSTENDRVFLDIENDKVLILLDDKCMILSL